MRSAFCIHWQTVTYRYETHRPTESTEPDIMSDHEATNSSTTDGLPIAPALGSVMDSAHVPPLITVIDRRVVFLCGLGILLGVGASAAAEILLRLIGLITNLCFYGTLSTEFTSPAGHHLGLFVLVIPIVGAIVVGFMARYGSPAIRGHGIPEAMEQVLTNQSRIPARVLIWKPISTAVSIGTGGPFGAEGPIIATGGAMGSLLGQLLHTSADERKTLLAAGAAAGTAAIFGTPFGAVMLAIELLLFEFKPRSIIPVTMAAVTAAGIRVALHGAAPVFPMPDLQPAAGSAMAIYIVLGALVGVASVFVTRAVYAIEDAFDHLPIHWMWWPAIGAIAVGVIGYFAPRTLGVGYDNITDILGAKLTVSAIAFLCGMKFLSWAISLGSGTSGGTLAPLFTVGGGLGALLGAAANALYPAAQVDIRVAALVGMAAIFAGAARAVLTSVIFAFETTLQPLGLLPLLGGCAASYLISCLMMTQSIMTEKIARRGIKVPSEYGADALEQIEVATVATRTVVTLTSEQTLADIRRWIDAAGPGTRHQGFPVVDGGRMLIGVVTRRDLLDLKQPAELTVRELIRRPPVLVYSDCTLRQATDHMVRHDLGRLPVVDRAEPGRVVGILTRSDILSAYRRRIDELQRQDAHIDLRQLVSRARS